ncbi:MAG: AAA family ATPase [Gammaproteobacteria bacterium]|nr:AAA family ATPase [Gammaproteobacteria bacterium]
MNAADRLEQVPDRVLLMRGSNETHIDRPGAVYASIALPDIEAMTRRPARAAKERAPCAIFSTYLAHDGRAHQVQAAHGQFVALPGDIDEGDPHIAAVDSAIVAAFGNIRRIVYSTASATPQNRKWRFIIPLADPIPGDIYRDVQRAAFELMAAHGISCDTALERPGQVAYLPNVPPDRRDRAGVPLFYDHWVRGTELFSVSGSAIECRMIERQRVEEQAREAAQAAARARAQQRRATHTGALPNVMGAFNESVRIEDLLGQYGYERNGRDWRSPHQKSGSHATRIMGDGDAWVSLSESDAAAGLGSPGPRGGCWGDAFDLITHYEHGGDRDAALMAAAKTIRLPDGRTLDKARADQWRDEQRREADRNSNGLLFGRKVEQAPEGSGEGHSTTALALMPITPDELDRARLTPRVILRDLLYADVRIRISAGGTGKTTLALFEAVTLALQRPLYGRQPERPCRTVIVTREDSREILVARLREIIKAMELTPDEILRALGRIVIIDKSGESFRLSQVIADVVVPSHVTLAELIEALTAWAPDWIIFDPLVSFGVGEQRVNDAEQGLIEAFRILRNRLDCCVEGIHHSGKANARERTLDQYSGRGGSALADGARMVAVMQPVDADEWLKEVGSRLADGENGIVMALPKLSYAKPQDSIFIRRHRLRLRMGAGPEVHARAAGA